VFDISKQLSRQILALKIIRSHRICSNTYNIYSFKWRWCLIVRLSLFSFYSTFYLIKLIIESSFELTFWIQLDSKSSCSHFQLDSSWVKHIFNSTRFNSTRNWVNSTQFIKNLSLTSRELNIEIFSIFNFCIIFLHYLLIESHEEKHEDHLIESYKEKHEDCLIESHKEKHEDCLIENHDEKTWRSFDKKSWWENMKIVW